MLYRTYKYYEMNEEGIIEDNEPRFITLKETVDVKKLEKEMGTILKQVNEFEYAQAKTEFYKFIHHLTKERFSNSLPSFVSFDSDPEII